LFSFRKNAFPQNTPHCVNQKCGKTTGNLFEWVLGGVPKWRVNKGTGNA